MPWLVPSTSYYSVQQGLQVRRAALSTSLPCAQSSPLPLHTGRLVAKQLLKHGGKLKVGFAGRNGAKLAAVLVSGGGAWRHAWASKSACGSFACSRHMRRAHFHTALFSRRASFQEARRRRWCRQT